MPMNAPSAGSAASPRPTPAGTASGGLSGDSPPIPVCSCFVLRRLARTITRLYDRHMARLDLKVTQFGVLNALAVKSAPISRLALDLGLERTTLSRNLKPLEVRRLVTIEGGPDPRQRIVHLAPDGRVLLRVARRAWRTAQGEVETALGAAFVSRLNEDVAVTQARLESLLGEPASAAPGAPAGHD